MIKCLQLEQWHKEQHFSTKRRAWKANGAFYKIQTEDGKRFSIMTQGVVNLDMKQRPDLNSKEFQGIWPASKE